MELYERIKIARKKLDISQRELGRRIGMTGQMISKIEQNKTYPSYETILKIASALSISASELMPSKNDEASVILKNMAQVFDNSTLSNMQCIKPLNRTQIIESFRNIALSIPNLSDVLPLSDEALYILLHSEEFKTCIDLLTCKYANAKIKNN